MKTNYIKIINDCIAYIEKNLKENITTEDILNKTYYSYPHFHRIFRDIIGESVSSYIRKRALSSAASDLFADDKTIIEIAMDYGYGSQQTFTRAFTSMFGISPQKYREKGMLDDLYKPFIVSSSSSIPVKITPIAIETLPAMKVASFHSYNDKLSMKNQLSQWNKVVSKAWGGLIKWQMSYEYQKKYGQTNKLPTTTNLGQFMVDNNLHLPPNTRYFGFTCPFPFLDTEYGYEAWAVLGNYSESSPLFLDEFGVEVKEFFGGLYAVAEATYGESSDLDDAWKALHYWIDKNDKYDYGEHQWLEEHITKPYVGGFHSFKLFMPIKF
ncbi:helix-turn-helix domain-containing protein [Scatolibacter rhodanostii]|uniref:helix-turn-helix domain-containing protein n=1 Tax=Scatolibacter rhodanostii TaxID=2014781 RepID=UPI000C089D31|nr:helix-turn-helix domain-containing protein [Scatolibacter rhodanostii]